MKTMPENDTKPESPKLKFLAILTRLSEDERNAAYVDANCWRWPTTLEQYKEAGFDEMGDSEKMADPTWKAAWWAIEQCTSEFGRSQAWWVIELGRTKEEHAAWIANGCRATPAESGI